MNEPSDAKNEEGQPLDSRSEPPSPSDGDSIAAAARRLAVLFTDDTNLPTRYRRRPDPLRKATRAKVDSSVEKRFTADVEAWRDLILTMFARLEGDRAWRFINLRPESLGAMQKITGSRDFCDFIDYMILRRDKEQCGSEELGRLALLSVAFQREIEKQLQA